MKDTRKLQVALLGAGITFLIVVALCEWKRRLIEARSNGVLRVGHEQYIAEGQTQTQYFTHSIAMNNRLVLIEIVLVSLVLLTLVVAAWLFLRYQNDNA